MAKIALVGPSYPFRGGWSQYTTLMYRNLKKSHDVRYFSFYRQYPMLLFPGKTDKDYENTAFMEQSEKIIDAVNPFTWLRLVWRIARFRPDITIFQWGSIAWSPLYWSVMLMLRLFSRTKAVMVCHNVRPHEKLPFDSILTKMAFMNCGNFIVHSTEDEANLRKMKGGARIVRSFLPNFDLYAKPIPKEKARALISEDRPVVLYFGFIRPYKGIPYLLRAMPDVLKRVSPKLYIVGEFWKGSSFSTEDECIKLVRELKLEDDVCIIGRYVPNDELSTYISAADVLVLPYLSATQSAVVQTAYNFNLPCIVTDVGGLPDVVEDGVTGYVVKPEDPKAIADAVIAYYDGQKEPVFRKNIEKTKKKFSWDRMVETVESFLQR